MTAGSARRALAGVIQGLHGRLFDGFRLVSTICNEGIPKQQGKRSDQKRQVEQSHYKVF